MNFFMHVYFFITCVIFCFCKNRDEKYINKKKEYIFFFVESINGKSGEEERVISFFCGEKNLNKNKDFF